MRLKPSLALLLLSAFAGATCSSPTAPDPDLTSVRQLNPCNGGWVVIDPPPERLLKKVYVEHEYDDCASVIYYVVPEVGEQAFPPCWGHGGAWIADFGEREWTCLDGTTRSFEEGASSPYDGEACVGLELGCAYSVHVITVPRK